MPYERSRNLTLNVRVDHKKKFFRLHRDMLKLHIDVMRNSIPGLEAAMEAAMKEKGAVWRRDLIKSIGHAIDINNRYAEVQIQVNSDYAAAADLGYPKQWPALSDSIIAWAEEHGWNVFLLRRHISRKGTKPKRYSKLAKNKMQKLLTRALRNNLVMIIRRFNQ